MSVTSLLQPPRLPNPRLFGCAAWTAVATAWVEWTEWAGWIDPEPPPTPPPPPPPPPAEPSGAARSPSPTPPKRGEKGGAFPEPVDEVGETIDALTLAAEGDTITGEGSDGEGD